MSEVGDLVKAVNQGLKAEKAGVSIRQRRNKLCLRAVLPHKDGSNREVQYGVLNAFILETMDVSSREEVFAKETGYA